MRNLLILFIALVIITACSKDEFNPLNPKDGQKVELFLDHYRDVNDLRTFLLPEKTPASLSLREFDEREPGYTYKVAAKVVVPKVPMQDGPDRWFELIEVLNKERYVGDESFEIGLIGHDLFGNYLAIRKVDGQLKYGKLVLYPINEEVKLKLEGYVQDIELLREELIESKDEGKYREYKEYMRKLVLKAVVSHDPENLGKGYLVHSLRLNE